MTDRTETAIPAAAQLVAAVRARDPHAVACALDQVTDWPALAVLLADNIGCAHDPRIMDPRPARRDRTCPTCGTTGRRTRDTCIDCTDGASPRVLKDGHWVNRGGIQHWQAAS